MNKQRDSNFNYECSHNFSNQHIMGFFFFFECDFYVMMFVKHLKICRWLVYFNLEEAGVIIATRI